MNAAGKWGKTWKAEDRFYSPPGHPCEEDVMGLGGMRPLYVCFLWLIEVEGDEKVPPTPPRSPPGSCFVVKMCKLFLLFVGGFFEVWMG